MAGTENGPSASRGRTRRTHRRTARARGRRAPGHRPARKTAATVRPCPRRRRPGETVSCGTRPGKEVPRAERTRGSITGAGHAAGGEHPAPGPRRLLRRRRAARQAVAARPPGGRRRGGRPGRRRDGVLRGAGLRRALGHVDRRGPAPVPGRDGVPRRPVRRLPARRPTWSWRCCASCPRWWSPRRSTRRTSTWLSRPATRARPVRGRRDGDRAVAEGADRRGDRRRDRLGRHRHVEAGGEDRFRPGQAERAGRRPAGHRARRAAPAAGHPARRGRAGDRRAAAPDRRQDGRRPRVEVADRPGGARRQGARRRGCTRWRGPRTTGPSSPTGRRSRCRTRRRSSATSPTSTCWAGRSTRWRRGWGSGCGPRRSPGAR